VANRKQRRRRAKEQRHDYVWVDDEGKEVEPEGTPSKNGSAGSAGKRFQRTPQAPSWARTLKRGLIFAPIMFATVFLLSPKDASIATKVTQTLLIVAIFVPFSYLLDGFFYRSAQRRAARSKQADSRRG
jgi:hypothetical protein